MNTEDLKKIVKDIVAQAEQIKQRIVNDAAPVNYACIFCQNDEEYALFIDAAKEIGKVVQDTETGLAFQIKPLETVAGDLQILKVRKPDPTRPERGDADFTLSDYKTFKQVHLNQNGFKLIKKSDFEMIEYKDPKENVLLYFSNPTLGQVLGIL
jgi:hypothetical protein